MKKETTFSSTSVEKQDEVNFKSYRVEVEIQLEIYSDHEIEVRFLVS